jgi:hypothetical protein
MPKFWAADFGNPSGTGFRVIVVDFEAARCPI